MIEENYIIIEDEHCNEGLYIYGRYDNLLDCFSDLIYIKEQNKDKDFCIAKIIYEDDDFN